MKWLKKKWLKKMFVGFVIAVLASGILLTACSQKPAKVDGKETVVQSASQGEESKNNEIDPELLEKTGGLVIPLAKEKVKFTMVVEDHPTFPIKTDLPMIQKILELTNVEIDIQAVPAGSYEDKKKILLASGDFPDVISVSLDESKRYGENLFTDINEYLASCPNLTRYFNEKPAAKSAMKTAEGKIFGIPRDDEGVPLSAGWLYRKDIFEKEGIKAPATTEEFYQALKTLKAKYPEASPYVTRNANNGYSLYDWSDLWGTSGNPEDLIIIENGKAQFAPATPAFKSMLEYVRKLYAEQLIDPKYMIAAKKDWEEALTVGKAFTTMDWISRAAQFNAAGRTNNPEYEMDLLLPPKPADGPGYVRSSFPIYIDGILAINKNAKNKEVIAQFYDFIYSPMGSELNTWGIEGDTFEVLPDGGRKYTSKIKCAYNPEGKFERPELGIGVNYFQLYKGIISQNDIQDYTNDITKTYLKNVDDRKLLAPPKNIFTANDEEERFWNENYPNLMQHYVENIDKFIISKSSMDQWDKFIMEFEKFNVGRLVEIRQAQYDRTK